MVAGTDAGHGTIPAAAGAAKRRRWGCSQRTAVGGPMLQARCRQGADRPNSGETYGYPMVLPRGRRLCRRSPARRRRLRALERRVRPRYLPVAARRCGRGSRHRPRHRGRHGGAPRAAVVGTGSAPDGERGTLTGGSHRRADRRRGILRGVAGHAGMSAPSSSRDWGDHRQYSSICSIPIRTSRGLLPLAGPRIPASSS